MKKKPFQLVFFSLFEARNCQFMFSRIQIHYVCFCFLRRQRGNRKTKLFNSNFILFYIVNKIYSTNFPTLRTNSVPIGK